jgi:ribosomal protein S18 acetylase RimI-like enzyme
MHTPTQVHADTLDRMAIVIRTALAEDATAILRVHTRARATYYRGYLPEDEIAAQNKREPSLYEGLVRRPDRTMLCAELDGDVAGFALIGPCHHPEPDPRVTSQLYQIHVDPERFRLGVGGALHDAALDVWRAAEVTAARLWVWDFNTRALAFYAAHGWVADGHEDPDPTHIDGHRQLGLRLGVTAA